MKIKTLELIDATLDWAVCIAQGIKPEDIYIQKWGSLKASLFRRNRDEDGELDGSYTTGPDLLFSRKWESGGPIIEREGIDLYCNVPTNPAHKDPSWRGSWRAKYHRCGYGTDMSHGPTPLIAAMRCYVASKLGDEVEIPNELIGE